MQRPRTLAASPALRRRAAGSFMLEALIGILIFSLGVLGLVGLQAQSIRHMNDAQYRGEAVYLANSLVARMWTDDPRLLAAKYQPGGAGYDAFLELAKSLPGSQDDANKPVVIVEPHPTAKDSSIVTVRVNWLQPGDAARNQHNYTTTAVVGVNP